MDRQDILKIIEKDSWMMEVLKTVATLHLPDWWIGAGFVRSKIWDHLHNLKTRTPLPDVDVIYFDPKDFSEDEIHSDSTKMEKKYEVELSKLMPKVNWSVTNQARMHIFHPGDKPYKNSSEALSHWVETATCVGVRLEQNRLELTAPHGIDDLTSLILKPTVDSVEGLKNFRRRITEKDWLKKWPRLKVQRQ
jgi:hypothetical protein